MYLVLAREAVDCISDFSMNVCKKLHLVIITACHGSDCA